MQPDDPTTSAAAPPIEASESTPNRGRTTLVVVAVLVALVVLFALHVTGVVGPG